jgi:hypothetical protein
MRKSPVNKIVYTKGQRIGECIYLEDAYSVHNWRRFAKFRCNCGKEFIASIAKVKSGHTKSCGCNLIAHLLRINQTHGMHGTPEYTSWVGLRNRCLNKKFHRYEDWGGRGIIVCDRWLESFDNFYEDMGPKPFHGVELDRKDNNGPYSKENCQWGTRKEQANNRRSNVVLLYKGESMTVAQWCEKLNLPYFAIIQRIKKLKWTPEKALETPIKKFNA